MKSLRSRIRNLSQSNILSHANDLGLKRYRSMKRKISKIDPENPGFEAAVRLEYELIQQKKSSLPRMDREKIKALYAQYKKVNNGGSKSVKPC